MKKIKHDKLVSKFNNICSSFAKIIFLFQIISHLQIWTIWASFWMDLRYLHIQLTIITVPNWIVMQNWFSHSLFTLPSLLIWPWWMDIICWIVYWDFFFARHHQGLCNRCHNRRKPSKQKICHFRDLRVEYTKGKNWSIHRKQMNNCYVYIQFIVFILCLIIKFYLIINISNLNLDQ